MGGTPVEETPEWRALVDHQRELAARSLRELFAADPERGRRFALEACGWYLDHSKNRIDARTLPLLVALAESRGLSERRDQMFRGDRINSTEGRAVLHVALRAPSDRRITVDGVDVVPGVHEVLARMADFCERVRGGEWRGHTGRRIRDVVNIGIGGSDLGAHAWPSTALKHPTRDPEHGLPTSSRTSTPTDFAETVRDLDRGGDPLRHLLEDLHHAGDARPTPAAARRLAVSSRLGGDRGGRSRRHFVAVSTNEAEKRGRLRHRAPRTMFGFWDWVGGRYSLRARRSDSRS